MKKYQLLLIVILAFAVGYGFRYVQSPTNNGKGQHKKVTGIGGIFFKCSNRDSLMKWYNKNLGMNMEEYGCNFAWRHYDDSTQKGFTLWAPFGNKTKYFNPSTKDFMMNYRVENLEWLLGELKKEGIVPIDKIDSTSYGNFVHIMDLEGNKIELWQPDDKDYEKNLKVLTY